jgi:hypothetical protein
VTLCDLSPNSTAALAIFLVAASARITKAGGIFNVEMGHFHALARALQ